MAVTRPTHKQKGHVSGDVDDGDGGGTRVPKVAGVLGYGGVNGGAQQVTEATKITMVHSRTQGDDRASRWRGRSGGGAWSSKELELR